MKDELIKLCMERLEMISKILHYDLKANEKEVYERDIKEILAILDDEKELRNQYIDERLRGEENE